MSRSSNGMPMWQVCDLESTSGTFVNNQPLQGCQTLQPGDRITLGQGGPEFILNANLTLQGVVLNLHQSLVVNFYT